MKKQTIKRLLSLILIGTLAIAGLTACGAKKKGSSSQEKKSGAKRTTLDSCVMPEASGEVTYGTDTIQIDASHTDNGYVMINYTGDAPKVQVQITNPDGSEYPYPLQLGDFAVLPLTGGDGTYQINVLENVTADMYSVGFSQALDVTLADEFQPYIYPNQYVNYTQDSGAVAQGRELSNDSSDDMDFVTNIYNYVIENISYDQEKAANITVNYIPDVEDTLTTKKGICFDYASLMSAMLRSQGIPTKLVVGYSGTAYHAWISVYMEETGWVDDIIEFNGQDWSLMDPTLAASNNKEAVKEYVGDGTNYTEKYSY